jgi:methionine-rich copper-binding protein CopC
MARRRSASQSLIAAVAILLCLAAGGGQALAHARLVAARPAENRTATPPPSELRLKFSEAVERKFAQVKVSGTDGKPVATGAVALDPDDKTTLIVPFAAPLADGDYLVSWQVVSADGHRTRGSYRFAAKK